MGQSSRETDRVDTAKRADRRTLRFESIDQALAEADRLSEAERASRLVALGNWTLGQALGHLAVWAEYSYTGAPARPPLPIRLLLRLQKKKFLSSPMKAGIRIPRVEGGTFGIAPMALDEGLQRCRRAFERLKTDVPSAPNVIFGMMTHQEWIAINLRHAELHLGFFIPR